LAVTLDDSLGGRNGGGRGIRATDPIACQHEPAREDAMLARIDQLATLRHSFL
jgi:hypothetical protein